ncbi:MAG: LysM peptidoglycan-binding domain-containing protein [Selenomonadaceae bacterium]|nr:LysM peptidoglycan-binding domain-containing protein [Selenomonadaceae bacterium]
MRSRIIGAVILLLFVLMAPLGLSNDYLRSRDFDTITVKPNENVWSIAARYVSDEKKAADLREAIIEINDLQKDGRMYAGQVIRVPVLSGETPSHSSEGDANGFL